MRKVLLLICLMIFSASFFAGAEKLREPIQAAYNTQYVLICVSSASEVYHSDYCYGLNSCKHEVRKVTVAEAVSMGRRACKICY